MLAENDLQRMYDLAHCLHPENGVALAVTLEAYDRIALLRRLHERRTGHDRPRLAEACLPQYCVYLASDARERAQEQPRPGQGPRYRPTPDDWLVRYLKCLIWWTMDKTACHVAVALGCFLYGYQPGDIAQLAPELFPQHHIRRVHYWLAHQLQSRFPRANLFRDDHLTLRTRAPADDERRLVQHSLAMFTPWGSPHVPAPGNGRSILGIYFDKASAQSDWERIHALIDPACAGLPRLIGEYNQQLLSGSAVRLGDPDQTLAIPCFAP